MDIDLQKFDGFHGYVLASAASSNEGASLLKELLELAKKSEIEGYPRLVFINDTGRFTGKQNKATRSFTPEKMDAIAACHCYFIIIDQGFFDDAYITNIWPFIQEAAKKNKDKQLYFINLVESSIIKSNPDAVFFPSTILKGVIKYKDWWQTKLDHWSLLQAELHQQLMNDFPLGEDALSDAAKASGGNDWTVESQKFTPFEKTREPTELNDDHEQLFNQLTKQINDLLFHHLGNQYQHSPETHDILTALNKIFLKGSVDFCKMPHAHYDLINQWGGIASILHGKSDNPNEMDFIPVEIKSRAAILTDGLYNFITNRPEFMEIVDAVNARKIILLTDEERAIYDQAIISHDLLSETGKIRLAQLSDSGDDAQKRGDLSRMNLNHRLQSNLPRLDIATQKNILAIIEQNNNPAIDKLNQQISPLFRFIANQSIHSAQQGESLRDDLSFPPENINELAKDLILAGQAIPEYWKPHITQLNFIFAKISDVSPLAGLGNLQRLYLNGTQISDLSPLAGLGNLQHLSLSHIQISDFLPLAGLVNLQLLNLDNTQISDLSPLAGLGNLQRLYLDNTQISDLSPLAGLGNLQRLDLNDTQISDLSPLAGLGNLQHLYLNGTQISDFLPLAGLVNLQSLSLNGTQISDFSPLAGLVNLQDLSLNNTQISDFLPLAGLVNLQELSLNDTQISDLSPLAGLGNLQHLSLNHTQIIDLSPLAGLGNLQRLDLNDTQISDLSPLAGLVNLQLLNLDDTQISDFLPLAGLVNLQLLNLDDTQISDFLPLAGLVNLQRLDLDNTQISDLSPLAGLGNLQHLSLSHIQISDFLPLAGLVNLQLLNLDDTQISDFLPLAGLVNLQDLSLNGTQISNLSPLAGLVNLQLLNLDDTQISDFLPLAGLVNLQDLSLNGTQISDLSPLAGLGNLQRLILSENADLDISPLSHLKNLEIRKV